MSGRKPTLSGAEITELQLFIEQMNMLQIPNSLGDLLERMFDGYLARCGMPCDPTYRDGLPEGSACTDCVCWKSR